MEIDIRPLEANLLGDYLDFFDDVAFSDNPDWAWCYCTYYHLGAQDEKEIQAQSAGDWSRDVLRNIAIGLIGEGRLRGYLAYAGGRAIGWCNVGDKSSFKKLCENADIWDEDTETRIKSIVCFIVAPGERRKGVATALLERVAGDAAREGYAALEAYPAKGALDCYRHYHGHPEMYEKSGFVPHKELKDYSVYRKPL